MSKIGLKPYITKRVQIKKDFKKDSVNGIINNAINISHQSNCDLDFSMTFDLRSGVLNAQNTRKDKIIFNAEWAVCLCRYNNEEAWNAFRCTIGHEEGHDFDYEYMMGIDNEREFKRAFRDPNDRRFILWIDEVHADFYGAVEVGNRRDNVLSALKFKANYAAEHAKKKDEKSFFHPSWKQRIYYIEKYDFDRGLIYLIANETKCSNKALIEDVCQHFPVIDLDPTIENMRQDARYSKFGRVTSGQHLQRAAGTLITERDSEHGKPADSRW